MVLGELASRALSPGINDPGTAVDVIGTAVRLLTAYRVQARDASGAAGDGSVLVPPVAYADLLDDVFRPIASDGATSFAVAVRLQKALAGLAADAAGTPQVRAALQHVSQDPAARADAGLSFDADKTELHRLVADLRPMFEKAG